MMHAAPGPTRDRVMTHRGALLSGGPIAWCSMAAYYSQAWCSG